MTAHVRRVETLLSPAGLWDTSFQFGDWLDPDASPHEPWNAKADRGVVATACLYRSASLVAETAALLGRADDAETFRALAERTRVAFVDNYVADDGTIRSDCTTVYTLAIVFGLLDEEQTAFAGERLAQLVAKSGHRISTGFAGTPFITDALTLTGHVDDAYQLLLQRECPSWLYPVTMGATTVWERWDSMLPDGTINPGDMTSFNHYALGAVADWMHRTIGGLSATEPGYAAVRVAPRPGGGLTWAETALETAQRPDRGGLADRVRDTQRADHPAPGRQRRALPRGRARRRAGRGLADPHQGDRMNLEDLLGKLDVRAKVRLLTGATFFTLHDEPAVELAAMAFSDGPTGVRGVEFSSGPRASLLPNATLLASAWSEEVAHEVGALLAEEAERQHIHVVLGPTINLHRTPLGGRLFEAYSEDPLLTGRLAAAYVRGLQERGIGACLKHLVANEAETERHTVNSRVDERTLRELYLLPFEIAVQDSDPWSVMAAYNDVNGVPATEQDDINNGILKQEWGWSGLLMSDWFATKSAGPAANGGLDLVMPGPERAVGRRPGRRRRERRGGRARSSTTTCSGCCGWPRGSARSASRGPGRPSPSEPDSDVRRAQLRDLAASGMTVLRNDGTLPLARDTRVALIGRNALETTCMGGGSAQVRAPHQVSVAEGLTSRLGAGVTVVDGVAVRSRPRQAAARPRHRPGHRRRRRPGQGLRRLRGADPRRPRGRGLHRRAPRRRLAAARPGPSSPRSCLPGALRLGVLGAGDWTFRAGDFTGSAAPRMDTDDLAEAILRPPGWETDVVLAERHRGGRRGRPDRLPAGAQHARPGRRAHSPDGRRGHRGRGRRGGGGRGGGRRGRAHRGAGDRGARQGDAGPARPAGRAGLGRRCRGPRGPWSW